MTDKPVPDYVHGCPLCGVRHHGDTTIGFSRMNRRCARKFNRLGKDKKDAIIQRSKETG